MVGGSQAGFAVQNTSPIIISFLSHSSEPITLFHLTPVAAQYTYLVANTFLHVQKSVGKEARNMKTEQNEHN